MLTLTETIFISVYKTILIVPIHTNNHRLWIKLCRIILQQKLFASSSYHYKRLAPINTTTETRGTILYKPNRIKFVPVETIKKQNGTKEFGTSNKSQKKASDECNLMGRKDQGKKLIHFRKYQFLDTYKMYFT